MEILLGLLLVCAGIAAYIGSQKGRSGWNWFVAGFLLGIFGLIAACAVPAREKKADDKLPNLPTRFL